MCGVDGVEMLDVKRKLKLLAIEEEIAHLELQVCREDGVFLGAKSKQQKADDADIFLNQVLNSVIAEVGMEMGKTFKVTSDAKANIEAYFKNAYGGLFSTATKPEFGWQISHGTKIIMVLLGYGGDALKLSVISMKDIKGKYIQDLKWTTLWVRAITGEAAFIAPRESLKKYFKEVA